MLQRNSDLTEHWRGIHTEIRIIPKTALPKLIELQNSLVESFTKGGLNDADIKRHLKANSDFMEFLEMNGKLINNDKFPGVVYLILFDFLYDKNGIELQGEMFDKIQDFRKAFRFTYIFLTYSDRSLFLEQLNPSRFSIEEMQSYIEHRFYEVKNQLVDYGAFMFEGLRTIFQGMTDLGKDQIINIYIY